MNEFLRFELNLKTKLINIKSFIEMTSSFNKDELLGNLLAIVCSLCFVYKL